MSMLDGISQCWPLAERCHVWWEAWAVAVAFLGLAVAAIGAVIAYFGVLGSWAAAYATYMAVIQPLKRRQLEDRVAIDLAMENFAGELIDLRYDLGGSASSLGWLRAGFPNEAKAHVERHSIPNVSIPSLTPTPENRQIVEALNRLRRSVNAWNSHVQNFDIRPNPFNPSDFAETEIERIKRRMQHLIADVRAVAAAMRDYAPAYAGELQWVASSGDGFLPYYSEGDRP
ncbi:TPA: hypothetical protein ACG4ML_000539 [Stenotrophomonas maltophilia]|uniref:hypothetical protein n=1 Tax=Stenotrophomonas maltophilia TaxID=40324 RepID=UPI00117C7087|nr:hypothetical protein [Stenotrophomonas maltophilia]MBN5044652.1 hypothetical protein [Stenotrophomonas maltophilia]MCO7477570.1 hypothetical protein [Stenotrophomonas maltophilia]HDS1367145.1 hypothetical protein [Stenotrophomonas maltophilia]HDS1371942.1 hypothetical protein [Stenotrophomonas maltophilia]HDS1376666.1 hypothetical protein [Stenotrophomonas maltophilia]